MDKETLQKIATLSKLKIADDQIESVLADFNKIMSYVDQINELDTGSISDDEVYYYPENRLRKDEPGEQLTREDISSFAPEFENGYIVVPKVIDHE